MKKIGIGIIFLCAVGIGILVGMNYQHPAESINTKKIHEIDLFQDKAKPDTLLIQHGDTVQFNTKDGKKHNIALGKGNDFNKHHEHQESSTGSGEFGADEGYRVTLEKAGTYNFHDHLNPNIFVVVVVYDPLY